MKGPGDQDLTEDLRIVDRVCDAFEQSWQTGGRPDLLEYLNRVPEPLRSAAFVELVSIDVAYRRQCGEQPHQQDYLATFSQFDTAIIREFSGSGSIFPVDTCGESESSIEIPLPVIPGMDVIGCIGRGGMGLVFAARQLELNRLVAVKMMRDGTLASHVDRARFRSEAESAARLKHANIVQVYHVGMHGGQPYLVLEYVAGGTLQEYLRNRPQSEEFCATLMHSVAIGISHAHERGVVHRDLKPANILLESVDSSASRRVQPKITDFGLARRMEDGVSSLTQTGVIVGTPGYLAPEQVSGVTRDIGPWTDVYAIGAVLYEMLTGHPPHRAATIAETLRSIQFSDPVSPGKHVPGLARDLQTICLKCMAHDRRNRYESAAAVAADLNRFLTGQPILARPAPLTERLWRWVRRDTRTAVLAALLLTMMLIIAVVTMTGVSRNRRNADLQFQAELNVIDRELSFIDREEFVVVPEIDRVRRDLLNDLVVRCTALLEKNRHRSILKEQIAGIHLRIGSINELAGRLEEGESAYRRSLAILPIPLTDNLDSAPPLNLVALETTIRLASLLQRIGRLAESESLFNAALAPTNRQMDSDDGMHLRASALLQLGRLQIAMGRFIEGEASLQHAHDIQRSLVSRNPKNGTDRLALASTLSGLAHVRSLYSQLAEAEDLADESVQTIERLIAEHESPDRRFALVQALTNRGRIRAFNADQTGSEADLLNAYATIRDMAEQNPLRPDYLIEAALLLHDVGRIEQSIAGDSAKDNSAQSPPLETRYRRAIVLQRELIVELPQIPENHRRLAITLNSLATWLCDKSGYVTDPELSLKYLTESESLHHESEQIWLKLSETYPEVWEYQNDLAKCHQRYGIALSMLNRLQQAEKGYLRSLEMQTELSNRYPEFATHRLFVSALSHNLAEIHGKRNDNATAERLLRKAIETALVAYEMNPRSPRSRLLLAQHCSVLADLLLQQGRHQDAFPLIRQINVYWPQQSWLGFGPVLTSCQRLAEAAAADMGPDTDAKRAMLREYEDYTLELVRLMQARRSPISDDGFSEFLQGQASLEHVRHRPEFREIMRHSSEISAEK